MRLICPNCGAQYEVAQELIPENGRDVQCSDCGHTWFEATDRKTVQTAAHDKKDATQDPAPAASPAPRPTLDASVTEILREEAAREKAVRDAEAETGLQSQGDLGLDETPPARETPPMPEAQERIRRLRAAEAGNAVAVAETVQASRKELLPDIDDINASLRSDAERDDIEDPVAEQEEQERKRGFRFGFLTMLLVIAALVLVYVFAESIAAKMPGMTPALENYAGAVDRLRLWLDLRMQDILTRLEDTGG